MELLSVIFALLIDRIVRHLQDLRDLSWFEHYTSVSSGFIKTDSGMLKFAVVLALPLILFALISLALDDIIFGIPYFLFSIAVLVFCLGPSCLSSDIDAYLDARSLGDDDDALHYAGILTEQAASTAPDQQTSDVIHAILHLPNERIFSVIFWFILLGPFGAVMYRLTTYMSKQDIEDKSITSIASQLQSMMAWVPARMLAAGYALTGNFDGALNAYQATPSEDDAEASNADVLIATGLGALRGHQSSDEISSIRAASNLATRSIMVWIAVLALLTLGGWLG